MIERAVASRPLLLTVESRSINGTKANYEKLNETGAYGAALVVVLESNAWTSSGIYVFQNEASAEDNSKSSQPYVHMSLRNHVESCTFSGVGDDGRLQKICNAG